MKSKKVLAQLAALSLLFGVAGAGTAWADTSNEVQISGEKITAGENLVTQDSTTKTKYTMADKTVAGLYMEGKATLTATNVNFVDAEKEQREVAVDGGSALSIKGGSVSVAGLNAFAADGGSTITTDGTKITSSVFANNSAVTLKDSTTSSFALYAGNEWSEGVQNQTVATGLGVGTLTIDGGTASAKNVLVQNKGTITVKNAVLDVTGDGADNDADVIAATGLKKMNTITVRAWGPNKATAEKGNNDTINQLDKPSEFVAEKATVKANAISVAGNKYVPDESNNEETQSVTDSSKYVNWAKFTATDSTVEAKDITLGTYGMVDLTNTKV